MDDGSSTPRPSAEDLPLVVFDRNGDAWAFRNYHDAAGWIEAVDVIDGEYHAYDADGYVLSLTVAEGDVQIRRTAERAYEETIDQLRTTMRDSRDSQDVLAAETLKDMIERMLRPRKAWGLRSRLRRHS
jgi:hypothetical protein